MIAIEILLINWIVFPNIVSSELVIVHLFFVFWILFLFNLFRYFNLYVFLTIHLSNRLSFAGLASTLEVFSFLFCYFGHLPFKRVLKQRRVVWPTCWCNMAFLIWIVGITRFWQVLRIVTRVMKVRRVHGIGWALDVVHAWLLLNLMINIAMRSIFSQMLLIVLTSIQILILCIR